MDIISNKYYTQLLFYLAVEKYFNMLISRRKFLHSVSALAIATLSSNQAEALLLHGSGNFNNGRSQVNLGVMQYSGDFPFLNLLKTGSGWIFGNNADAPVTPDLLDANGYPSVFTGTNPSSGYYSIFYAPAQVSRPGNYIATWTGNGTVGIDMVSAILPSATFTGSVTSNILTAGAPSGGTIQKGMKISTGGIVADQITGSAGLAGTYRVVSGVNAGSQSITVSGGSTTGSGGSGRYVFSTQLTRFSVSIATAGVSDFKVFHVDDEAAINAGQIFGTKFKQKLVEANFGVIRFLDWQQGNTTSVSTWATRKPSTYFSYYAMDLRSALYCSSTSTASNVNYSTSAPSGGFSLTDKATIHLLFTSASLGATQNTTFTAGSAIVAAAGHGLVVGQTLYFDKTNASILPANISSIQKYWVVAATTNTLQVATSFGGTPVVASDAGGNIDTGIGIFYVCPVLTLNVAGTGAIDIVGQDCSPLSLRNNTYPINGTFRSLATLVYDAALNVWIKRGGDIATNSVGIENACPFEIMVQLCAEVGAHPYFVAPPFACTPMTDWHTQAATYVRDHGPAWMIPRFEGPNELWNTGFNQTAYAQAVANSYGWGYDDYSWYGKALSTIGQAVSAVYSNNRSRYHVIGGVQTISGQNPPANDPRFDSTKYVAQVPAAQVGYTKTAAKLWTTHICCAQYITPPAYKQAAETTMSNAFAGVSFTASVSGTTMNVTSIDLDPNTASHFTGSITSNVLTVTAGTTPVVGAFLRDFGNIPAGVYIIADLGGGQFSTSTVIDISSRDILFTDVLAIGKTIFGRTIANGALQSGVTIVGGSNPNWTISSSLTIASDRFYAGTDMTQPAAYMDTLSGVSATFNLNYINDLYVPLGAYSVSKGINGLCGYEGGYSPDYTGGKVDILRFASKLVKSSSNFALGLQTATTTNYNNFIAAGGTFPSDYKFSGQYESGDAWSVLEDIWVPTNPPQQLAIIAFNH